MDELAFFINGIFFGCIFTIIGYLIISWYNSTKKFEREELKFEIKRELIEELRK
jgi:hypothetical protein